MPASESKRLLYYCQSLVSVGHLACRLNIIGQLVRHAQVDLIYGGPDTASMLEHPNFRALRLRALLHDAASGGFFDPVFVRGDPDIIRVDETFSLAPEIEDRVCHTGYISPPVAPALPRPARKKQIPVSQNGGDVGRELLEAAMGAAALIPDDRFSLATVAR